MRTLDRRLFRALAETLIQMGFEPEQAAMRAGFLCYAAIGFVHGHQNLPSPSEEQRREFFRFITARPNRPG